ncbi:YhcH/YjgK/YiaL family protein [soil metagenome]
MIIDTLEHAHRYLQIHPMFALAFAFLASTDLKSLPPGRRELNGQRLIASIDHVTGLGRGRTRLEAHRRYIDIQVAFDGCDEIGWRPLGECRAVDEAHDETRDVGFWKDRPDSWIVLSPGRFAIFFPEDAHAPLAGSGAVKKAVMKIAVAGRVS